MEEEFYTSDRKNVRKKSDKGYGKKLLFVVLLMVSILMVLMSPVFQITEIKVSDTLYKFSQEEICAMGDISIGDNLFLLSKKETISKIKENQYIESVSIKKVFPSTVEIEVKERRVRGYIPYMDSYLYIDEYGTVIEISSYFTQPLPIVKGLKFDSFIIGEKIKTDNQEAFDIVVTIAQLMTKYEMLDTVVEINVSDTENVIARVNKVDVNLGDISSYDEKIRVMIEIMAEIPEEDAGSLDLSDLSKPLVFTYLK